MGYMAYVMLCYVSYVHEGSSIQNVYLFFKHKYMLKTGHALSVV